MSYLLKGFFLCLFGLFFVYIGYISDYLKILMIVGAVFIIVSFRFIFNGITSILYNRKLKMTGKILKKKGEKLPCRVIEVVLDKNDKSKYNLVCEYQNENSSICEKYISDPIFLEDVNVFKLIGCNIYVFRNIHNHSLYYVDCDNIF